MKEISEQNFISVTTDMWSDSTADSYNCVTAHWFNEKSFEIESQLIDVVGFLEPILARICVTNWRLSLKNMESETSWFWLLQIKAVTSERQ